MTRKARFCDRSEGYCGSERVKKRKRCLKQQIRDTKRLLSRPDLPETVRQVKERVLKMMVEEVQVKQRVIHERKINKKYKMIKFFEKRKVVRKLRSHLRILSSCPEEDPQRMDIISEAHQLRADLNYIVHYPRGDKYVALFPTSSETGQKALAVREEIFKTIQSQILDGSLPDAIAMEFSSETASLLPELGDQEFLVVGGSSRIFDNHAAVKQNSVNSPSTSTTLTCFKRDREDHTTSLSNSESRMTTSEGPSRNESKQHCLTTKTGDVITSSLSTQDDLISTDSFYSKVSNPTKAGRKGRPRDPVYLVATKPKRSMSSMREPKHFKSSVREPKLKKRRIVAPCDEEGTVSLKIRDDPFFV